MGEKGSEHGHEGATGEFMIKTDQSQLQEEEEALTSNNRKVVLYSND